VVTRPGLASRLAVRAVPLLRAFNEAGVLSAADVHVAQRLGRLAPEADERVLLAVALAVRAVRAGSVCVRLDDLDALAVPEADDAAGAAGDPLDADAAEATAALAAAVAALPWPESAGWEAAVRSSRLVADGVDGPADRPVRWIDGRCYLDRYWRDEQLVRELVDARLAALPAAVDLGRLAAEIDRLFPGSAQAVDVDHAQRLAAATAVVSRAHRRPGHREDDHGRPGARGAPVGGRAGPSGGPRGAHREGRRAPAGGGPRRPRGSGRR